MLCAVVYLCVVAMVMLSQPSRVQGLVVYSRSEATDTTMSETAEGGDDANKIFGSAGKGYTSKPIIYTDTDENNKPVYKAPGRRPYKPVKKTPLPKPNPENSTGAT